MAGGRCVSVERRGKGGSNRESGARRAVGVRSVMAGASPFTVTVNGSGFVNASVVRWNGARRATTFVSGNQLQA